MFLIIKAQLVGETLASTLMLRVVQQTKIITILDTVVQNTTFQGIDTQSFSRI